MQRGSGCISRDARVTGNHYHVFSHLLPTHTVKSTQGISPRAVPGNRTCAALQEPTFVALPHGPKVDDINEDELSGRNSAGLCAHPSMERVLAGGGESRNGISFDGVALLDETASSL